MNMLVEAARRFDCSSAGGTRLSRRRQSSCSTTATSEGDGRGGEARERYADLLERVTDQRPEEAAVGS